LPCREFIAQQEALVLQTVISVVLEVQPESADILSKLIDDLRNAEETPLTEYSEKYGRLKAGVPICIFCR
jgi:hypothetical protein